MKRSEKQVKIPDVIEARIQETYRMLGARQTVRKRRPQMAAAAIALACLILPGAAYASARTGFFQAMFGNETNASHEAIHREVDDGKGGKAAVTIPSKEYVPVDETKAEEAIGEWVMDEPITRQVGSHTLCIESFAYDQNSALLYFTLEREGGVLAISGDDETNLKKGAYFTDESDFYFNLKTKNDVYGGACIYVDTQKSTPDKMYGYAYILWAETLEDGDQPLLELKIYPCARKDLTENTEDTEITTEEIPLTDKEPIPVKTIDLKEQGYLEYSPISLSVDLSKGLGLSLVEAQDPYHLKYLEIVYADGSRYVVSDKENNVENSGYSMGTGTYYKTAFNRLANADAVEKIIVNDVTFDVAFPTDSN